MKLNTYLACAAFAAIISASACQQPASNNVTSNNAAMNTSSNAANASSKADNTAAAPSAGSPSAVYVAAYNARKNKDIPTLRSLMAKDILEFFEIVGEEEKKSVDDLLRELADRPQAATAESRNEKIDGDKATIEYLDEEGNWQPMDFVKEGGVWKMTLAVGDPTQADVPANTKK